MREVIIFNATTNPQICFPKSVEIGRGHFHCWATDTDTEDGEPIVNTRALVEFADGHVERIFPTRIKFVEPYATTANLAETPAGIARACGMENEVERAAEAPEFSDFMMSPLPFRATLGGAE